MDSGNQNIDQLLEKFSRGVATPADTDQLLSLLQQQGQEEKMIAFIEQQLDHHEPDNADDIAYWKERLKGKAERITSMPEEKTELPVQTRPVHRMQFLRKWGWAAAAVVAASHWHRCIFLFKQFFPTCRALGGFQSDSYSTG
jgi:transmembrane sensor